MFIARSSDRMILIEDSEGIFHYHGPENMFHWPYDQCAYDTGKKMKRGELEFEEILLPMKGIVSMDTGYFAHGRSEYAVILDSEGTIWSTRGMWDEVPPYKSFLPAKGLPPMAQVVVSHKCIIALDTSGLVWTFGSAKSPQIGRVTTEKKFATPAPIPNLPKIDVIEDGAASDHDGNVFTWGMQFSHIPKIMGTSEKGGHFPVGPLRNLSRSEIIDCEGGRWINCYGAFWGQVQDLPPLVSSLFIDTPLCRFWLDEQGNIWRKDVIDGNDTNVILQEFPQIHSISGGRSGLLAKDQTGKIWFYGDIGRGWSTLSQLEGMIVTVPGVE